MHHYTRAAAFAPAFLRQFCTLAAHSAAPHPDPRAQESFLVGCHHRISYTALVDWLMRNQKFEREAE